MSFAVRAILSVAVVAGLLGGCRQESNTVPGERAGGSVAAPGADNGPSVGPSRPDDGDTVLVIGKSRYTRSDFRRFYEQYATKERSSPGKMYDTFVNDRLLAEEVARGGYAERDWIRLEKRAMVNNVLANRFLQTKLRESLKPTEAEIARELPPGWDQVKLQIIVFLDDGPKSAEVVREAKAGADFGDLAARHSHVQNQRDGMTDWLFRDTDYFSKKDVERIFKMEKGEISDLIQGPVGFYLVRIVDKRMLPKEDQDHVLRNMRDRIYGRKREAVFDAYLAKAGYEVLEENLKKAARDSMSAGYAVLPDLPVLKIGTEEYPFRIVARMAGPKLFDVQKDETMVVEILRQKCRELVLLDRIGADARPFGTAILPEEQAQIDRALFLFGLNVMLAEKIPAGDTGEKYLEYLKELARKHRVERHDELVASMELPKPKSHPAMH